MRGSIMDISIRKGSSDKYSPIKPVPKQIHSSSKNLCSNAKPPKGIIHAFKAPQSTKSSQKSFTTSM